MPESIIAPELLELISAVASMISSTVSSVVAIFTYIAIAIGLFRMGKACGMKHTWLAFIPYAQSYRIGQIADHQCEVNEGKSTTYRRKLLTFHILLLVMAVLCVIVTVGIYTVSIITKSLDGSLLTLMEDPMFIYQELLAAYADAWLVWLAFSVISIINTVFCAMAMHKIAKLFIPKIAGLAVVLYLFVPLAQPILYLIMGARKPQYVSGGPDEGLPQGGEDMFYTL